MSFTPRRFALLPALSCTLLLALPGAAPADDPPALPAPDVTTLAATDATGHRVTLHAKAVTNGAPATAHFEYGLAPGALGQRTPDVAIGAGPGEVPVATAITTTPGATYYFRAVAENDDWVAEGDVLQVVAPARPRLVAAPPTDVTYKSATLHVTVATGGLPVTLTGSVQGASGPIPLGPVTVTADGDVAFPVTGLQADSDVTWMVGASSAAGLDALRRQVVRTAPLAPAPVLALSATKVRYGTDVRITGAVAGHPGLAVALHESWFPLMTTLNTNVVKASAVADPQGAFAFTVRATRTAAYGVTVAEGYQWPLGRQLAKLEVFPAVTAKVQRARRHRWVVSGSYRPAGVAAKASLYRGGAVKVGTAVSTTGRFAFPARALKRGRYEVRIVPAASTGYARGKSSMVAVPRR